MKWPSIRLGNVLTLKRGHDLPDSARQDGMFPVVSSSGITGLHNKSKAKSPGVVTGRYGTLGQVFYIKEDYWPLNTSLYVTDFKGNHPRFVAYFLQSVLRNYQSDKAAVPGVNRNVLHELKVHCPDTKFHERIVDILSAYDELIDTNRRRIQLLEESARLLFREWFVYFRFPGHEKVKIVDGVPEGWKKEKVKNLGEIVTGKTPSKKNSRNFDGNIPLIKTPDMHKSSIVSSTEESLSEIGANSQNNKYLLPWSIQVSCIGTVGIVTMNLFKAQTNQQINSVIPKKDIYRYYAYFCLSRFKLLLEAIGGGSTMANVNKNKFENLNIIIPNEDILKKFHEVVDSVFKQIATILQQNQKLAQARDLLLPRLMSGAIEV